VVYNAGRVVTYAILGTLFGFLGRTLLVAGMQQWLSMAIGVMLLLGLIISPKAAKWTWVIRGVAWLKRAMGSMLRRRGIGSLGLLGLLNGLLPCGLVYVACAGAAATGGVLSGALYMIVFGLGTVPMMLAISLSGKLVHAAMRRWLVKFVPASVGLVAVLLILRGLGLGIPYVSPDLTAGEGAACCHEANP
jgi:sulfite exporter TauE/SafE